MATLRKLPTMVAVAAFTAALSGCGGGNDNEVGALNDDIAALQTRVSTLMTDLEAAQDERDSANAEVTRLEGELGGEEAAVTRLTGGLASANAEVTRLEGELEDEEAKVTRLEGELEDEGAKVTRLTGELERANARGTRLQVMLDTTNEDKTRLQGLLDSERGEVNRLQGEFTTAQSAAAVASEQVKALQGQLDTEEMEVARLMQALTDARTAATTERARLQGDLNTAKAKVTQLEADLAAANRTANDAESEETRLQGLLNTASEKVTQLEADLRTANTEARNLNRDLNAERDIVTQLEGDVSRLNTRISSLEEQLRSQQAGIVTQDAIVRAESIVKAIKAAPKGDVYKLPFGEPTPIKRSSVTRGNTVAVMLPLSPLVGDLEFSGGTGTAATGTEAAARNGWNGVTLTRTRTNGSVDEVTIYSDIEAADALTLDSQGETQPIEQAAIGRLGEGDKVVRITRIENPSKNIEDRKKLNMRVKYVSNVAVNDRRNKEEGDYFRGTYRGISGEFTCVRECDLSVDLDGMYSFPRGNSPILFFKPDRPDATYDRQDNDGYLYFGWWLHSPTWDHRDHEIVTFSGSGRDVDAARMPSFMSTRGFGTGTGTYNYRGVAAGQYVRQTRSGGDVTSADFGSFTASARLQAKVKAANDIEVAGSITNFITAGTAQSGWEVTFDDTTVDSSNGSWPDKTSDGDGKVKVGFGLEDPTFLPPDSMSVPPKPGNSSWSGNFYNSDVDAEGDPPDTATGKFSVSSEDNTGHIIGAFGVTQ